MSRDHQLDIFDDQHTFSEVSAPTVEVLRYIRPQIIISWTSHADEIPQIVTFTSGTSYIAQNFTNLPVYASCPFIEGPPKLQ